VITDALSSDFEPEEKVSSSKSNSEPYDTHAGILIRPAPVVTTAAAAATTPNGMESEKA